MAKFMVRLRGRETAWPEVCACCGEPSTLSLPPRRAFLRKQAVTRKGRGDDPVA